ncbi:hypothetical protein D5085_13525 [Ectothiorhodospiraceae bacterium BW-2]|nr:hypothetical protein D5085_13525 [Ectothiorhodospiraceae bacterium BW-2]
MRTVVMRAVGAAEQVLDYVDNWPEPPEAAAGEVTVALAAAGVDPIDTKNRSRGLFFGAKPSAILGGDGAGEMTAVC